jgi:hypothetical protein
MSLLRPGGTNHIGVRGLAAATAWYREKLGLPKIDDEMDEPEGCIALGFIKDEYAITLGPPGRSKDSSRGVNIGEIQQDRQGTHYSRCGIWKGTKLR